ncbi:hypothetical protein [Planomonospora algeriensis]
MNDEKSSTSSSVSLARASSSRAERVRARLDVEPGGRPAASSTARWVSPRIPRSASRVMAVSATSSARWDFTYGILHL